MFYNKTLQFLNRSEFTSYFFKYVIRFLTVEMTLTYTVYLVLFNTIRQQTVMDLSGHVYFIILFDLEKVGLPYFITQSVSVG